MKHDFNPQCITYSQMNMIFNSRIYYRRLMTWTRAFLISKYYGSAQLKNYSADYIWNHWISEICLRSFTAVNIRTNTANT